MVDATIFEVLGQGSETTFVGGSGPLAELERAVSASRLVTLFGPAGVGKTRVAFEFAKRAAARFPGGVVACSLAHVEGADALRRTLAAAFEPRNLSDIEPEELIVHMEKRGPTLLVADQCEAAAALLGDPSFRAFIARAERLVVLMTSRARIGFGGEHVVEVLPLSTSRAQGKMSEAATLLEALVIAHRAPDAPRLEPALLEEIAGRLDGLPLAIELLASQSDVYSLEEIHRNLMMESYAGLDGLAPALGASLERSWSLLSESERFAAATCSYFADGFTREAFEAVASSGASKGGGDSQLLRALVRKSIVRPHTSGRETRFRPLSSVRAFLIAKRSQLGIDARAAFVEHVGGSLAERFTPPNRAMSQDEQRAVIAEAANVREALTLARGAPCTPLVLARLFYGAAQLQEAGELRVSVDELGESIKTVLAEPALPAGERAGLLLSLAQLAFTRPKEARVHAREALDLAAKEGLGAIEAASLLAIGRAEHALGLLDEARATAERLLDHPMGGRDTGVGRRGVVLLMGVLIYGGDVELALAEGAAVIESCIAAGDVLNLLRARTGYLIAALTNQDYEHAIDMADRALSENPTGLRGRAWVAYYRGFAYQAIGRYDEARADFELASSLLGRIELANERMLADLALARLAYERSDLENATKLIVGPLAGLRKNTEGAFGATTTPICLGTAACIYAAAGEVGGDSLLASMRELILPTSGPTLRDTSTTFELLYEIETVARRGDAQALTLAIAKGRARLDALFTVENDIPFDAHLARRLLHARLVRLDAAQSVVLRHKSKRLTVPDGGEIDLAASPALYGLIDLLVLAHAEGSYVSLEHVLTALWPNERMLGSSGRNRVYVLFNRLRKIGLRDIVETGRQGWRLRPDVRVERLDA